MRSVESWEWDEKRESASDLGAEVILRSKVFAEGHHL